MTQAPPPATAPRSLRREAYNAAGRALVRLGADPVPLDADAWEAAAVRATGLTDWGDEASRRMFRKAVESARAEGQLTLWGRRALQKRCRLLLINRLLIRETLRRRPDVRTIPIVRPVFILGWFRTGTTLLHRLLAQDPAHRCLFVEDLLKPVTRIEGPGQAGVRERDRLAAEVLARRARHARDIQAIHSLDHQEPVECGGLLDHTFYSKFFEAYGARGYCDWLEQLGHDETVGVYEYFRGLLQLLTRRRLGCSWLLKYPGHLENLASLLGVFPDARVIQTHRDPVSVVPSACNLYSLILSYHTDDLDYSRIGRRMLAQFACAMERSASARAAAPPGQIFDVSYRALVNDPMGAVKSIYAHFQMDLTSEARGRMERWLAANPQGKHGRHVYSLEQFGLDEALVRRTLMPYSDQFGALL